MEERKYEYKTLSYTSRVDVLDVNKFLRKATEDGWDVVSHAVVDFGYSFLLKRVSDD